LALEGTTYYLNATAVNLNMGPHHDLLVYNLESGSWKNKILSVVSIGPGVLTHFRVEGDVFS
jgi:hypothetical protein